MRRVTRNLIVAIDAKGGISKLGKIPWSIPEDMNFFRDVTCNEYIPGKPNALIMGRNTWESFGGKLNGRVPIVVSSQLPDAVRSVTEAYELCEQKDFGKVFICGGSNIYRDAYALNEIYLTQINKDYECYNFFPMNLLSIIENEFMVVSKDKFLLGPEKIPVTFTKYRFTISNIINTAEQEYLNILKNIITNGNLLQTRNGNTISIFNQVLKFDLQKGFPLLTTKKIFTKGIIEELLFFLKGDTNANHLDEKGVKIWNANTSREFLDKSGLNYETGDMGAMYGFVWRHYGEDYQGMNHNNYQGFDQIEYCLNLLKTDPFSRRILMTTYDPSNAKKGVLYPCHGISIIFNVGHDYKLHCSMTQRSADFFLGVPFNIASYALLIHLFCEVINNDITYTGPKFIPGELMLSFGNVHIYENHYTQCIRQILREPKQFPKLEFTKKITSLTDIVLEDIKIVNYQRYPGIIAKMVA